MAILNCVGGTNELFSNFVPRFEAKMALASSKIGGMKLGPAFYAFLPINNCNLENACSSFYI